MFAALASFAAPFKVAGRASSICAPAMRPRFRFRFCPVCGTNLFHTEGLGERSVGVAVGAFADPDFPPPQVSVYDSRRHPWVQLPLGTAAYERDPD